MVFGTKSRDEDADEAPQGIMLRWSTLGRVLKVGLGVGAFSVIAGSILADVTTQRGSGASKVAACFPSPSDRAAMQRAAAVALTGDIATGSIKLDPCALPKK